MEYRRLGNSGLKVSALSFGAWVTFGKQVDDGTAEALLSAAYEGGVNFFDNAEAYADGRAEQVMGAILKKKGWPRDSFVVSSKVFFGAERDGPNQTGLSRKHVVEACHAALKRFQLEYLDLYFCHRPDPETPIEETARAMHDLIVQGKVLYWGTSEWNAEQLKEAYRVCDRLGLHAPAMEQPQYNLFHRRRVEGELTPLFRERGLASTIWSPLASGLLTGKYNQGIPQDTRLSVEGLGWLRQRFESPEMARRIAAVAELARIATELGVSLPKLAIAWCLKNPHVSTVILGASKVSQLQENLGALAVLPKLSDEVLRRIDQITTPLAD